MLTVASHQIPLTPFSLDLHLRKTSASPLVFPEGTEYFSFYRRRLQPKRFELSLSAEGSEPFASSLEHSQHESQPTISYTRALHLLEKSYTHELCVSIRKGDILVRWPGWTLYCTPVVFVMAIFARLALLLIAYWGVEPSYGSEKDISEEDYYKSKC